MTEPTTPGIETITPVQPRANFISYRPDIDGLRAIAIAPVVLFHVGVPALEGGFVGVDVFFVISGYLMASLILAEIESGKFSLLSFYERRIRRIFPALFAMLAIAAVAAWVIFMPIEFEYFARSVIAAALFSSNFLFWNESGYFDAPAQLKPLLHTWSLAVEEQFYILFPLLLALLAKLSRRSIAPSVLSLLAGSFVMSVWQVEHAPTMAFYLSPPRFWELLLGAILALDIVPSPRTPLIGQFLALLGVALIAAAVFTYNDETPFPGLQALVPCLGAALVIYGRATHGPVGRLLGAAPLVSLGLISYSLYLWHWPLIVFTRYALGHELTSIQAGVLVLASLAISALSWRFIEQPFRGRASLVGRRTLAASAAAAVALATGFGGLVAWGQGFPGRLPRAALEIYRASYDVGLFEGPDCFVDSDGRGPSVATIRAGLLCPLGKRDVPPSFLVWGDSHAAAMAPAIDLAAKKAGRGGLFVGAGGCAPLLDFDSGGTKRDKVRRCQQVNAAVIDLLGARRFQFVFMVGFWPKYVHRAELPNEGVFFDPSRPLPLADHSAPVADALDRTLRSIVQVDVHAVLVMDVPEMGYDVPHQLAKAALLGSTRDIAQTPAAVAMRQALARATLRKFAAKYNATLIDPTPAICDSDRCYVEKNGVVLYRNGDHLSGAGAESISYIYDPFFNSLAGIDAWGLPLHSGKTELDAGPGDSLSK